MKEKLRRQRNSNQNYSSKSFSNLNSLKDITYYTCNQKGHYSRDKKYFKYTEQTRENPVKAKVKKDVTATQRRINQVIRYEQSSSSIVKTPGKGRSKP